MKAKLRAAEFKRIIDNTKMFTSKHEQNLMSWIYLEVDAEEKTIKATALDAHRVSIEYAELLSADTSFNCYIRPTIPKITRQDNFAELELQNERLYVQVGESIMGYVQPEGQFYKVNDLINEIHAKQKMAVIGINPKFLKEAMGSISMTDSPKAIIDIYDPITPIVIRSGKRGKMENLKIVLPMKINDCTEMQK